MSTLPLQFGAYYHIYNRGNNRENLFLQERNFPYFLRLYAKHILPVAETYAYCLMPNHFHFLIRTRTEAEQLEQIGSFSAEIGSSPEIGSSSEIGSFSENEPIFKIKPPSRAFNNLFIAYARAFNKATGRTGVLFETPFHRKLVDSDAYFQRLVVYIHANPQKHGFVDDFRDWKWTSYNALYTGKTTRLERAAVIDWFGSREGFGEFHQQAVDEAKLEEVIGDDED